jgi:ABC-type sugar transport system ATPase subunit
MLLLRVQNLSRQEQGRTTVDAISFEQLPLQRIAIAGETGSGKTSLLKMIGGLLQPSSGTIFFNNEKVVGPEDQLLPGHKGIAFLSQHFELRNNYIVKDWLEMANQLTHASAKQVYRVCRIEHLLARKNEALSGGEKQRIALARLLTTAPQLLLLDEPFSNLDRVHKQIIKTVIHEIGQKLNTSCILVSHDAADLLSWADELLIMKDGKIIQQGTPQELYFHPTNEYVAGLLGDYHLIDTTVLPAFEKLLGKGIRGKKALLRPEQLTLTNNPENAIEVIIQQIFFYGTHYEVHVLINEQVIHVCTNRTSFAIGEKSYIKFA